MLLAGIKTLLLGVSVGITMQVYPVIKRLYDLFLFAANFKFFDYDFIHDVWNNIYVLVGVVVLFAIAVKLLSAIVNPDTLTDDKKGARGTYFRAVIAVILIFVCPLIFTVMYDVQNDLIGVSDDGNSNENFLLSHIFGYEAKNGSIGQTLAWETFSAFCTPVNKDTGGLINISSDGVSLGNMEDALEDGSLNVGNPVAFQTYYAAEDNIDNIALIGYEVYAGEVIETYALSLVGGAGGVAASDQINVGFEYHSILCPLAGVLVAYEMLLLCMDTFFRAAKIALLQLMLPIVLGAYVFNPEILKKWAKEYFSTYIMIFLKVLAIGFMVIAINELKGVIF